MSDSYLLLAPLLLLGIVGLLGFVGCEFKHGQYNPSPDLPPVTNLRATPGDMKVDLSWDAYTDATSYEVKRGTVSGSYDTTIPVTAPQATLQDTAVTNGTSYYYVVDAITAQGTSGLSNEVIATPVAGQQTGPFNFVKKKMLGSLANSIGGWAGMEITVASNALVVYKVGRVFAAGNIQQHAIRIIETSGAIPTTAYLDFVNKVPGEYEYADVPTPVTLNANTTYYIVSTEVSGGDHYYQDDTTLVTQTHATGVKAVSGDGTTFTEATSDSCFGPLDFYYDIIP